MKKYSNLMIIIITFIFLILILLNREIVSYTIINSFNIWFNTLVPSMFPMFILSDILINYNFIEYIPNKISNIISKIFNINKTSVLILFISILSGFPGNANALLEAYNLKLISKEEVEHLLLFNHFPNPLFIIYTVGALYLNNSKLGIIILTNIYLSNLIIGIIYRKNNHPTNINYISNISKSQSFITVFTTSIKKSINTLLMISGTVTSFLIISTLLCYILNINSITSAIIKGILEMTMGLNSLSNINININIKLILSSIFIAFGSISIHMQIISILKDISYLKYLKGRLLSTLVIVLLSILTTIFFF